ncbi:Carboxyvinyl-carboxyphosphonate phosphorylmutase, chloroplastic [Cocos nucifera]|uniref:Carboxyvinyl-carboxyphosphonate phosphorylmutase, chloroplastic n=1 Tax=Cocos nucifera TaxID=13894 RepID=A0A8K0MVF3_COCNU|nr:Carboxyvinyl-carboxyphosphonate phosphorylmutase, chloroplastic [Cocos nucifera]
MMGFSVILQPHDTSTLSPVFSFHYSANRSHHGQLSPAIRSDLRTQRLVSIPFYPPNHGPIERSPRRRYNSAVRAAAEETPAKALRRILESPGIHQGPACFDALSAKLVQRAGFQFCFMSGFSVSAARLGLPDVGLISYGEMVDQGYQITQAVSIPVIGDGDNGYGNHMNVKRTVKGFIKAGFAGIILEDQVSPKACGHTQGRKVVSREESVMRIKAAIDARKESGSDIVIVARTDSRQAVSFEESLWRSRASADAGADVLFIDALASREEMKAFCEITPLLPKMEQQPLGNNSNSNQNKLLRRRLVWDDPPKIKGDMGLGDKIIMFGSTMVILRSSDFKSLLLLKSSSNPVMRYPSLRSGIQDHLQANMLEGGGKTPILNPIELEELGFKIVSYPLSLIGVSIRAMEDALVAIKGGRVPSPGSLPSFEEIKDVLGFNEYYEEEKRYSIPPPQPSYRRGYSPATSTRPTTQEYPEQREDRPSDPVVEVLTPYVYDNFSSGDSKGRMSGIWSRTLRLKITGRNGLEKLDVRIPAGFLEGMSRIIPGLGGVNIMEMLEDASVDVADGPQSGKILLDFNDAMGDRIQVFVE